MQKLKFHIVSSSDTDEVFLKGPFYEGTKQVLEPLLKTAADKCIFHCQEVTHINTCGIQEWVEFIQEFKVSRRVQLHNCTPGMVTVMNLIPIFSQGVFIHSVQRSFHCQDCQKEVIQTYTHGDNMPTASRSLAALPDQMPCRFCKSKCLADVPSEEFFAFLHNLEV